MIHYDGRDHTCPDGFERRRVGFGLIAHLVKSGELQSACGLGDPIWTVDGPYGRVSEAWPTCSKCLRKMLSLRDTITGGR